MKSSVNYENIQKSQSEARLATYESHSKDQNAALELYRFNLQISGAFLPCLAICEVAIRNTVSNALRAVYGENWAYNERFLRTLPKPRRQDVLKAHQSTADIDKIIPELPFVFWQSLFTSRFDDGIWRKHLKTCFCHTEISDLAQFRSDLHRDLEMVRKLRNRIAHHEPIFNRDLKADYERILKIVGYCSKDTKIWLEYWQQVTDILATK
ncbi:hypothetical protein B0181_10220 [Moraxella caviae]|uniref:Abortive infection bacteriophage resistance protein n=1 Tax=Moraxella caviae TaxID=34060 RepID=A0A1S9ZVT7_9GAMM|nr:Abi family protein [Moraxella caviae]OOR87523.1 hypothetical protein B0181_10220 [Moraxella caviae]STZ14958.1 Abortive infection bacteriophage resistance protein [Moraxella caviae]